MKKDTSYVSEIDELLTELRSTLPESKSQKAERAKHKIIAFKRDNKVVEEEITIWEEF